MAEKKEKVPTQKRLAAIDVFEESIVATTFGGGRVRRKLIAPEQAIEIFSGARRHTGGVTAWLDFGPGVIRMGLDRLDVVVWFVRDAQETTIACQIGEKKHCYKIKMPKLLAELRWSAGQWTKIERVMAFRGALKKSTVLYVPPVPNMYADGDVCMGSVAFQAATAKTASEFFETDFIKSLFSDHLASNGIAKNAPYRTLFEAIRKTKGKVPMSALAKITTYGRLCDGEE